MNGQESSRSRLIQPGAALESVLDLPNLSRETAVPTPGRASHASRSTPGGIRTPDRRIRKPARLDRTRLRSTKKAFLEAQPLIVIECGRLRCCNHCRNSARTAHSTTCLSGPSGGVALGDKLGLSIAQTKGNHRIGIFICRRHDRRCLSESAHGCGSMYGPRRFDRGIGRERQSLAKPRREKNGPQGQVSGGTRARLAAEQAVTR